MARSVSAHRHERGSPWRPSGRSAARSKRSGLDRPSSPLVGLGYVRLGQPLTTLSGGERQRIKLAIEVDRSSDVLVLDEPTTGLHMDDVDKLVDLMDGLVARGRTLIVIEHDLDIVASVEFQLEGEELAAVMASVPSALGPSQLPALEDGRPIVAVPFVGDGGPLGAVLLIGVVLDGEVRRLLALLARALGFAVSNALAHAVAETNAATDPLTGCNNRRAGLELLAQAARIAVRGGPAVGAMMLDLDHFKRVNDRHGHQVGDDVLHTVGRAIASRLRDRDSVTRYGGEEFLVTIGGADETMLTALAERVSQQIRDLEVPDGAGATVALTASVGVAVWSPCDTVESLIARADSALYAAKAAGRDRVVLERVA